ncbi:hypothetical protein J4Q44_G00288300 [Coregonus suidteri]|uniref:Uncharacterized protein n=1 Tax=Coregonus suidteri TaxID=861788 RepID=A0AAN8KZW5_9TELE
MCQRREGYPLQVSPLTERRNGLAAMTTLEEKRHGQRRGLGKEGWATVYQGSGD